MGWCSATEVFDTIASALLDGQIFDEKEVLKTLAVALRDADWDCEMDSDYWDHPVIQEIFRELEPDWFND